MSQRRKSLYRALNFDYLEDRRVMSTLAGGEAFGLLVQATVSSHFEDVRFEDVNVQNAPVWGPHAISILQSIVESLPDWAERAENVIEQNENNSGNSPDSFNISTLPGVSVIVTTNQDDDDDHNNNGNEYSHSKKDADSSSNISVTVTVNNSHDNDRNDDDDKDDDKTTSRPIKTTTIVDGPLFRTTVTATRGTTTPAAAAPRANSGPVSALFSAPELTLATSETSLYGDPSETFRHSASADPDLERSGPEASEGVRAQQILNSKLQLDEQTSIERTENAAAVAGAKQTSETAGVSAAAGDDALAPINAPEVGLFDLQGADLLAAQVPLDSAALDLGIQQLLAHLDDLGRGVAEALESSGWMPYVLAAACAGVTAEALRRRGRRAQLALERQHPALDNSWSWTSGAY